MLGRPFLYQSAGDDYELNVLWRLLSIRRQGTLTRAMVGPFWWSEQPRDDAPMEFQILGGLFARDCNYEKGMYRYRVLWIIPFAAQKFEVDTLAMFHLKPILVASARREAEAEARR